MSQLRSWIARQPHRHVPLFDADGLVAKTWVKAKSDKRLLRRHPDMEAAVIDLVEPGLCSDDWHGLLYVMGWGRAPAQLVPLYVGKAAKAGKTRKISANLERIRANTHKFARWGNGSAYHIGDLSQALFRWEAYKGPDRKYERWAEMLFSEVDPPTLRERAYLVLIPWTSGSRAPSGRSCTIEEAEEELIDLAIREFEDVVLNVAGETWFKPMASDHARPPRVYRARLPIELIEDDVGLRRLAEGARGEAAVGLDVETDLRGQRLCTLQLATSRYVGIVDGLAVGDLEPLRPLLASRDVLKVIHNAHFERRVLGELGLDVHGVYDTLDASRKLRGMKVRDGHRLESVCKRELGVTLSKNEQVSDWTRRPLTRHQIEYAAIDAEILLTLREALLEDAPPRLL